ncbi:MAG: hypothetical protein ABI901_07220 [Roseiflexaceae bacterium]
MPSVQGYRLNQQAVKPQRPLGLAVLATIGMLGSLVALMIALVQLLGLLSARPNLQLAIVVGALVLALVCLWINWGFWDLIRWAWGANLLLSLIAIGGLIAALRWTQPIGAMLAKLRPTMSEGQVSAAVMAGLLALIVYQAIVILYIFSVRATFGVGVKDERPIWERANRRQPR